MLDKWQGNFGMGRRGDDIIWGNYLNNISNNLNDHVKSVMGSYKWPDNFIRQVDSDADVTFFAELPGFKREDISITINSGQRTLMVEADGNVNGVDKAQRQLVGIPPRCDAAVAPAATYTDGVLMIVFPVDSRNAPRHIEIK